MYWISESESGASKFLASFRGLEIKADTDCKVAKKFYSEDLKVKSQYRSEGSMPSRVTAATRENTRGLRLLRLPFLGSREDGTGGHRAGADGSVLMNKFEL